MTVRVGSTHPLSGQISSRVQNYTLYDDRFIDLAVILLQDSLSFGQTICAINLAESIEMVYKDEMWMEDKTWMIQDGVVEISGYGKSSNATKLRWMRSPIMNFKKCQNLWLETVIGYLSNSYFCDEDILESESGTRDDGGLI